MRAPYYKMLKNAPVFPPGAGGAVKIQPELPVTFVLFAPAYHVAPPVALDLVIER
jgi:hypothetical protein